MKTAVSEAVTNAIIHGYENEVHNITIRCRTQEKTLYLEVEDQGRGIEDVEQAMEPLFTTKPETGPVRDGIFLHGGFHGRSGGGSPRREKEPCVKMKKGHRQRTETMDHTVALIQKIPSRGMKRREHSWSEENDRAGLVRGEAVSEPGSGGGGPVPDRQYRPSEGHRQV